MKQSEQIKMLQAQIAQMAQAAAIPLTQPAVVNESFTIPQSVADMGVETMVNATDEKGRAVTFMAGLRTFAQNLPAALQNKPLPDIEVSRLVDACVLKYRAAYAGGTVNEDSIKARKTTAKKLFTCAPLLPTAFDHGIGGTVDNIKKFCTVLQNEKFAVPNAVAKFNAPKPEAKVDLNADAARLFAGLLALKGEHAICTAVAKAQLVALADFYGIKGIKGAEDARNPALLAAS